MSIVATTVEFSTQRDGSRHVIERHTDDAGKEYLRSYFIDGKTDLDSLSAQHADELAAHLAARVVEQKLQLDLNSAIAKVIAYANKQADAELKAGAKLSDDEIAAMKNPDTNVVAEFVGG